MSARKRREQRDNKDEVFANAFVPIQDAGDELYGALDKADALIPQIEKAIVDRGQGIVDIGNFRLSSVGLEINGRVTEEEWKAFFEALRRINSAIQWIIGDWVVYGEDALHWSYDDMADLTGYGRDSIKQYAYVCRNVGASIRIDAKSFGHCQVVASLPPHQQKDWLLYAKQHNLSVAKLREAMGEAPALPTDDPLGVKTFKRNSSVIGRITNKLNNGVVLKKDDAEDALRKIDMMRKWLESAERMINNNTLDD